MNYLDLSDLQSQILLYFYCVRPKIKIPLPWFETSLQQGDTNSPMNGGFVVPRQRVAFKYTFSLTTKLYTKCNKKYSSNCDFFVVILTTSWKMHFIKPKYFIRNNCLLHYLGLRCPTPSRCRTSGGTLEAISSNNTILEKMRKK